MRQLSRPGPLPSLLRAGGGGRGGYASGELVSLPNSSAKRGNHYTMVDNLVQ